MTSTRKKARSLAGQWWAAGLGGAIALAPLYAHAAASDLYYERALMSAAHVRCGLFTPQIASALDAGRAQARGAALRSGVEPEALAGIEGRAKAKAAQTSCTSADLTSAAGRVRTGFEAYSKKYRETYAGDVAGWTAERNLSAKTPTWGLTQPVAFGADRMIFGLAGSNGTGHLTATVLFADAAQPYSARIVMRDPARTTRAFLDARKAGAGGKLPLSARIAPVGYTRAFTIDARGPADPSLAPGNAKGALLFRFPAAAAAAMADLDPREAVRVEFLLQGKGGERVRAAYVEVGDFAAGRAFALAQR